MAGVRPADREPKPAADVYILSYPKTGRTWLRALVGKALVDRYGLPPKLAARDRRAHRHGRPAARGLLPRRLGDDRRARLARARRDQGVVPRQARPAARTRRARHAGVGVLPGDAPRRHVRRHRSPRSCATSATASRRCSRSTASGTRRSACPTRSRSCATRRCTRIRQRRCGRRSTSSARATCPTASSPTPSTSRRFEQPAPRRGRGPLRQPHAAHAVERRSRVVARCARARSAGSATTSSADDVAYIDAAEAAQRLRVHIGARS